MKRFVEGALTAILTVTLSVMMIPAVAFAEPNPDDFAYSVVADGNHNMQEKTQDINTEKNGVLVESKNAGVAIGNLEGNVSAAGTGVEVIAYDYSSATSEVTGDITSTESQSYGVIAETQAGAQKALAQTSVGNVEAPSGVKVEADGGTATVVAKDVTATQVGDGTVESNLVSASGGMGFTLGQANFNAGTVSSESNGLNIRVSPLGYVQANTGAIKAGNDGINARTWFGAAVVVASAVSSVNHGIYSHVEGDGAANIIDVDGNVESTGNSAIVIQNDKSGKAMVLIANDAASAAESEGSGGLSFYSSDANAQAIALVMGVLSGYNGIVLEQNGYEKPQDTLDLTVWKVEANGGSIIKNKIEGADTDAFAKSVSYIVMVEQPIAGGTVRATKADGSPLDRKFSEDAGLYGEMLDLYEQRTGKEASLVDEVGFAVTHETDKVLLKVDLEKGYKVAHAYNGMGERVELLVDDKGDYYLIAERGGGIYLSVELELESYDIAFDLGGGTLNGQSGPIVRVCEYGSVIQLPGAPTREGYNFLYWQGSHYDPGASYTVEGAHTFTAIWEKKADPTPDPPVNPVPSADPVPPVKSAHLIADNAAASTVIPQTGDEMPVLPVAVIVLLAGAALVRCSRVLRQR